MHRRRRRITTNSELLNRIIEGLATRAADPRRQVLAEVIECVLRRAGFAQAAIEPDSKGYPRQGSVGFWMRIDSIGPGVLLTFTGGDERDSQVMAKRYHEALQKAFIAVLGKASKRHVRLYTGASWHVLIITIPTDDQLAKLHNTLAR